MAYTTQMHFLRIQFPHEILSNLLADNARFTTKSYEACCDVRAWSLNRNERAQYLLEVFSGKGNELVKLTKPVPPDHPDHPDHPDNPVNPKNPKNQPDHPDNPIYQYKAACVSNEQYKKQIKDLQEQVASLLCKLECCQSVQAELEDFQKECCKSKCDAEDLKCKLEQATENCTCSIKENENLKSKLGETCQRANEEYNELQKKYKELECKYQEQQQQERSKSSREIDLMVEENTELKRNLKESCKKITSLQNEICCSQQKCRHTQQKSSSKDEELDIMDKMVCKLEMKLEEYEQENNELQETISNNDHIKVAQAEIDLLTKENKSLYEQLNQICRSEHGSMNDNDQEDYPRIKMERDILKSKFTELQPDLEELANVVEEFTELENSYNDVIAELDTYKEREELMLDRLKMLMRMEQEFTNLQMRVCESERLLNEYQVLQKLECLRGGYQDDRMDDQEECSEESTHSDYSESDDYDSACEEGEYSAEEDRGSSIYTKCPC